MRIVLDPLRRGGRPPGTLVANPTQVPSATRDRDDDYLVALLGSSADLLVSGDKDLTDLDDARIVSPRAAIEILRAAGQ